jgi:membrane protein implicated in regulation of membrane protease activity
MTVFLTTARIFGILPWIFWLVIFVLTFIAELATVNMTSIWFSAGALIALIMSMFDFSVVCQVIAFFIVSTLCLALFIGVVKPRLSKRRAGDRATNADRIIGKEGLVTVRIDPLTGSGRILVIGQSWSAKTKDDSVVEAGEKVLVLDFESVYAIVERID